MFNIDTGIKIAKLVVTGVGMILPVAQKAIGDRDMKKRAEEQFAEIIQDMVNKAAQEAVAKMKTE